MNLARRCASHLRILHNRYTNDERFRIDVLGYVNEVGSSGFGLQTNERFPGDEPTGRPAEHSVPGNQNTIQIAELNFPQSSAHEMGSRNSRPILSPIGLRPSSSAYTQLPSSIPSFGTAPDYLPMQPLNDGTGILPLGHNGTPSMTENLFVVDDMNSISQMFLDQQFLEMDRVITYDDGMFAPNMEWWDQNNLGGWELIPQEKCTGYVSSATCKKTR